MTKFYSLIHVALSEDLETAVKVQDPINYAAVFKRILLVSKPEWFFLILALICAIIIGASIPAFSILFGEFYGALAMDNPALATQTTNELCLAFLVLGILIGIAAIIQTHMFNMAGVYLTTRIR